MDILHFGMNGIDGEMLNILPYIGLQIKLRITINHVLQKNCQKINLSMMDILHFGMNGIDGEMLNILPGNIYSPTRKEVPAHEKNNHHPHRQRPDCTGLCCPVLLELESGSPFQIRGAAGYNKRYRAK